MSVQLKSIHKRSELAASQSGASMHFWGICCESGKQYAQVVGQRFRITMAVLDPTSHHREISEKTVTLIVIRDGIEYLLCVLKHGEIHQVNLNLIFDKGENVVFYINGQGKVYLSGYQLTDSGDEVLRDENGYLCPLVEVKLKGKKDKSGKSLMSPEPEAISPKKKKFKDEDPALTFRKLIKTQSLNGDDDDDDDDEDDSDYIGEEEEESESEEDSSDEEVTDELDEEEEDEEMDDKIFQNSIGSQKRKKDRSLSPQKRKKNDFVENPEDVICIDNGSGSDSSDEPHSSAGNTPMPKKLGKQMNTEVPSSEKKKKKDKKKKRLSEISNISEIKDENTIKSVNESTPNKQKKDKKKNPVQKLEGGVEYQDVVIGRGPVATKGKMLHVFYVGRLEDNRIFDSRVAGKKPFNFKLGASQVIKGWDVGLQGMRVGGQRKLKIPPNMGYGSKNIPSIPANSTLFFSVELQAVS